MAFEVWYEGREKWDKAFGTNAVGSRPGDDEGFLNGYTILGRALPGDSRWQGDRTLEQGMAYVRA